MRRLHIIPFSMVGLLVLDLESLRTDLEAVHLANRNLRLARVVVAHEPCRTIVGTIMAAVVRGVYV